MAEIIRAEKRVRKARRNYEKELASLEMYCRVSIETLRDVVASAPSPLAEGKIIAFERVLDKIGGAPWASKS